MPVISETMAGALGDLKRVHHGRCTEVQIRGFCEAVTIYNGFAKWWTKKWNGGMASKKVLKLQYLGHCGMVPHQQSSKNTIKVSSIQSSENWWHIYFRVELEFGGCDIDAVLVQVFLRRRRHLINTRAVMEEHKGLCSKSQASISALRSSVYLLCAVLIWTESSFISQLAFLFRCDVSFFSLS